jgi:hypothetical protein
VTTPAARAFAHHFRGSPALYPFMLDAEGDRVLLATMSEADFRQASFLDQRVLGSRPSRWISWPDLVRVADGLPASCEFIFHIGHVGSTLVSRLLGELPSVFALREPLLLRTFADLHRLRDSADSPWPPEVWCERLAVALGWLSRSFRPEQRAMIKATSFVSEIAAPLLGDRRRALFLYARPETYLETILAGEASRQELAVLSGARLERVHARLGAEPWRLPQLSEGERAALAWACEMTALEAAASASGDRILWLDFDAFLASPAAQLVRIAAHFGHPLGDDDAERLIAGPILHSYSKAPEHGYSPELRRQVLAQARSDHATELRRGRAWFEAAARDWPAIARAVARAAGEG